jgi:CheY-like chemotaxis protein
VPRRRIVLLVEPDPETQSAFRVALEARGFQVWVASDGDTALDLVRQHAPGVIIGDFPIELGDGELFTRLIRSDPQLQRALIITVTDRVLTGKDSLAWMNSDRVLYKPIPGERLAEEVAWAVDRPPNPAF